MYFWSLQEQYLFEHTCNLALVVAALNNNIPDSEVRCLLPVRCPTATFSSSERFAGIFTPASFHFSFLPVTSKITKYALVRVRRDAHLHCSPDVSRTWCNPGRRPERTNQRSHSSVTHLCPYYQQHLRSEALAASDRKYHVNSKIWILTDIPKWFVSRGTISVLFGFICTCVGVHTPYWK